MKRSRQYRDEIARMHRACEALAATVWNSNDRMFTDRILLDSVEAGFTAVHDGKRWDWDDTYIRLAFIELLKMLEEHYPDRPRDLGAPLWMFDEEKHIA